MCTRPLDYALWHEFNGTIATLFVRSFVRDASALAMLSYVPAASRPVFRESEVFSMYVAPVILYRSDTLYQGNRG